MLKPTSLFLCILLVCSPALAQEVEEKKGGDTYGEGYIEGRMRGEDDTSAGKWMAYGLLGGFGCGLIGCGLVTGLAFGIDPGVPPGAMLEKGLGYQAGFSDGYSRGVHNMRIKGALIGGAIGVVLTVAAYMIIVSSQQPR